MRTLLITLYLITFAIGISWYLYQHPLAPCGVRDCQSDCLNCNLSLNIHSTELKTNDPSTYVNTFFSAKYSSYPQSANLIIKDQTALNKILAQLDPQDIYQLKKREIKWPEEMLIGVFLGPQIDPKRDIEVTKIIRQADKIRIQMDDRTYGERCPDLNLNAPLSLSPFQIIRIPRSDKPIEFQRVKATFDC